MPVVVCRPVDASELHRLAPHIPVPDPHDGSTVGQCEGCGQDVYLGPEQDAIVKEHVVDGEPVLVGCILCVVRAANASGLPLSGPHVQPLTNKVTPARFADGTIDPTFGTIDPTTGKESP